MQAMNINDRIFGVVLAGGRALRYGRLKQVEPIDNTCLLGIVVKNALMCSDFDSVLLVLGHEFERVLEALAGITDDEKLKIIINKEYESGMSASLRAGLRHAKDAECDAVAFLLGDMPFIDAKLLSTVITHYRSSSCRLCYVQAGGHPGHPVVVRRDLFDEFLKIRGDKGGKEIIQQHPEWTLGVEVNDQEVNSQFDINTKEDMKAYLTHLRGYKNS